MKNERQMVSRKGNRTGSWLFALFLLFCFPGLPVADTGQGINAFSAKMVTTIQGHTTVAHMTIQGEKMRIQMTGGRIFSTMIARYDNDLLWLIAPAAQQYMELPLDSIGLGVPHFFHPETSIKKTTIGEETVSGIKAVKYRATVSMDTVKVYEGFLWEAIDNPDFPLKWEEPGTLTVVEWQERSFAAAPDSFFEIPATYRRIEQPVASRSSEKHQSLKAYPAKNRESGLSQ
ncbi:MAG: hypothetical protein M8357_00875 [Desulfobulbaceae bacterium]|nr:hypothetical protein [Desulfobulbaceae bacterium]